MKNQVADKQFLKAVSGVVDVPGTDVAVTYLAEVAPGMLLAQETDGEVVVYVNLKTYKQNPHFARYKGHLRERNNLPQDIGIVQNVLTQSLHDMVRRANAMVLQKNGETPNWYDSWIQVR
jgi:hypothetical protein